jgi:hypothetical protein
MRFLSEGDPSGQCQPVQNSIIIYGCDVRTTVYLTVEHETCEITMLRRQDFYHWSQECLINDVEKTVCVTHHHLVCSTNCRGRGGSAGRRDGRADLDGPLRPMRFWTLGEIVTAVVSAGLSVERLDEHPDWTDPKPPGTFTLLAAKRG